MIWMKYYVREKCYNAQVYNIQACKKKKEKIMCTYTRDVLKEIPYFYYFGQQWYCWTFLPIIVCLITGSSWLTVLQNESAYEAEV